MEVAVRLEFHKSGYADYLSTSIEYVNSGAFSRPIVFWVYRPCPSPDYWVMRAIPAATATRAKRQQPIAARVSAFRFRLVPTLVGWSLSTIPAQFRTRSCPPPTGSAGIPRWKAGDMKSGLAEHKTGVSVQGSRMGPKAWNLVQDVRLVRAYAAFVPTKEELPA